MVRLVLWRHGQTDHNVAGRVQGRVDIPLNEAGRAQAASAALGLAADELAEHARRVVDAYDRAALV